MASLGSEPSNFRGSSRHAAHAFKRCGPWLPAVRWAQFRPKYHRPGKSVLISIQASPPAFFCPKGGASASGWRGGGGRAPPNRRTARSQTLKGAGDYLPPENGARELDGMFP